MTSNQRLEDHSTATRSSTIVTSSTKTQHFRGMCLYPSSNCTAERAVKKNGTPHTLCAFHRAKHNHQQRKFDAKKRRTDCRFAPYDMQAMRAAATASEPPPSGPPPPPQNNVKTDLGGGRTLKTELQLVFRNRLQANRQQKTLPQTHQTQKAPPLDKDFSTFDNQGGQDDVEAKGPSRPPPLPPLATLLRRFHSSAHKSNN
ncbi:hypothetical protein H257_09431 [Aphanomyces astaci]|uniref:Uncharacterized protein n=1 Tax=Aphanomyces astaci TaxID=112090 RepID=W4G9Q2_APHAT|nr:hypothetical protein H257_09431 [Aphanomyces astaci]ETV76400.1 hypothetical protein H257_09431 [Aphanomyces astaci]|eukprot:XP_009833945.1 hypothetical protein H257_09431 [Aphanomyces astaci]